MNSSEKSNYVFNSSIKGIEETDLILLVATNPRPWLQCLMQE